MVGTNQWSVEMEQMALSKSFVQEKWETDWHDRKSSKTTNK